MSSTPTPFEAPIGLVHEEATRSPPSVAPMASVSSSHRLEEPIARRGERDPHSEPPAATTALRARMRQARARGDGEAEANAASRLVRHLLALDTRLDEAVACGQRAIALRPDDIELRAALATLLQELGEPGLAASILRPLVDARCAQAARDPKSTRDAAQGLLTLGDLLLRAGDVAGALESFRYVAVVAPERSEGQERVAIARGVAPSVVSAEVAARGFIGAARKHQLAGNDPRALEALARAFEVDAKNTLASSVLADALEDLGRIDAADAVRAEHAIALAAEAMRDPSTAAAQLEAAAQVQRERRERAQARGDVGTVVATVLDEVIELVTATAAGSPERVATRTALENAIDVMPELASARRRLRALLNVGADAGRLSADDWRAVAEAPTAAMAERVEAWSEVLVRAPDDERALTFLREQATMSRDPTPIVDALIRVLRDDGVEKASVSTCSARGAELAQWAEGALDDVMLAAWAWNRVLAVAPDDQRARDELRRLAPRVSDAETRLAEAQRAIADGNAAILSEARREMMQLLAGHPDDEVALLRILEAHLSPGSQGSQGSEGSRGSKRARGTAEPPNDDLATRTLERLARRLPPDETRRALELREAATPAGERGPARRARIEHALQRLDPDGARRLLAATEGDLAAEVAPLRVALAMWMGNVGDLGEALASLPAATARERGAILAAAARALRVAGRFDRARACAEEAMRLDPRELRGAIELAELASMPGARPPTALAGAALERALTGVGARGRWSLALAAIAEELGERALAAAWTRRAWSLRPGDVEVARAWIGRAAKLGDPALIAEVVQSTTALLASLAPIAEELAVAVRSLARDSTRDAAAEGAADGEHADAVLRLLLSLGATRLAPVRAAVLEAVHERPVLAIAIHERWFASGAPAVERPRVLAEIARTARGMGDHARAVDALARILGESEATDSQRSEACAMVVSLASLANEPLPPDAEILAREAVVEEAARAARNILIACAHVPLNPEQEDELVRVSDLFRALGRDLWDLADDRDSALRAWLRGGVLLGERGLDRLETDIAHFGGDVAVRDALFELARHGDRTDIWDAGVASTALSERFQLRAWSRLLERPPSYVEPVSLAREAAARACDPSALLPAFDELATRLQKPEILNDLYDLAAARACGRFGERGVRYRGARVLDRIGRSEEALGQAVRAFSAVPSEGSILVIIERLGRSTRRADLAIGALVEAADQAVDANKRAVWLDRAAGLAKSEVSEPSERIDLLLRLFLTAPSARTCALVVAEVRAAIAIDPSTRETWTRRMLRAHKKVDGKLGFVDRLPVLAEVVRVIAEIDDVGHALDLMAKGAESTPPNDLDPLRAIAEEVATIDRDAAVSWLDRNGGGGPVRAHIAWGAGDADRAIRLLVEHSREVDDLDFGESGPTGPTREVDLLRKWAPSAHDKRIVAEAWAKLGERGGIAAELAAARAFDDAGNTEEAARAVMTAWRARAGALPPTVAAVLKLARAVLPQAHAWNDLVTVLVDSFEMHPATDTADAVARWREIAEVRALHLGDRTGALDALVEAGRAEPGNGDVWNEISELAEAIGAHEPLAAALARRLHRARPDQRVGLLRKLARVLEHDLVRDSEAAERWAELVRILPLDAEAADALERIAERSGNREVLVELLAARASRLPVGHAERTRALRRVARELEGTAARRSEVQGALREVHQQNPADVGVALELAALARRAGDIGTAAEALLRAFHATADPEGRVVLAIGSAGVLIELRDLETASRVLREAASGAAFETDPRGLDLLRLQLEVAVARGDVREEALTRVRIAELDAHAPPARRGAQYGSAARALMALGERTRARELAWIAARSTPGAAAVAALVTELELAGAPRAPGETSPQDEELLAILMGVDPKIGVTIDAGGETSTPANDVPPSRVSPEILSIIAFGRAELLDARHGTGAGYRDLHAWPEEVRSQPLVQLALAERLAAEWSFAPATLAFERALAGDLRGFRALGPTALRAAEIAARSNDAPRARTFLDLAAHDPSCRIDARRRAVDLARTLGDDEGAIRALRQLAAESSGSIRATALAEQARLLKWSDPETALETMKRAVQASEEGSIFREELERELANDQRLGSGPATDPSGRPSTRREPKRTPTVPWLKAQTASEPPPHPVQRPPPQEDTRSPLPPAPPPAASPALYSPAPPVGPAFVFPSQDAGAVGHSTRSAADPRSEPHGETRPGPASESPSAPIGLRGEPPFVPPSQRRPDSARPRVGRVDPRAEAPDRPLRPRLQVGTRDTVADQPRVTVLGETEEGYQARLISTLPRPAVATGIPLDLESLDAIAADDAAPVAERVRALKTLGEAAHEGGRDEEAARHFISALELGDVAGGDSAAEVLRALSDRHADLLLVRRRQVFLVPGNLELLDGLHAAALESGDLVFARAIDHVRRALNVAAGPVPPPPLDAQLDRPDLVVPLLERRAVPAASEALRIAWEHAPSIFKRDFSTYHVSGVDRVQPAATHPLGRVILSSERLLGMSRTPVFVRQRRGRDVESILMVPPAVVLGGDCREDTPEVRYLLGAGLVGAHPSHCLFLSQSEANARSTWHALLSAFGPPEFGRSIPPDVSRLAAALWQAIPRAPQRRLGELLGQTPPAFDGALEGARQVARRGGLYLAGDIAAAVRATLAERGEGVTLGRNDPHELADLCVEYPAVADLVRLATSPEFAEARWRNPASAARRPGSGSGPLAAS